MWWILSRQHPPDAQGTATEAVSGMFQFSKATLLTRELLRPITSIGGQ